VALSCLLQEATIQPGKLGTVLTGGNCSQVIVHFLCAYSLSKSLDGFVLEYDSLKGGSSKATNWHTATLLRLLV